MAFEKLKWDSEARHLPFNEQMRCPHGRLAAMELPRRAYRVSAQTWRLMAAHFTHVVQIRTDEESCQQCLDQVVIIFCTQAWYI